MFTVTHRLAVRRRLVAEIWIVLGLAILPSSLSAIIQLLQRLAAPTPIGEQTATLNTSRAAEPLFDAAYQLLSIASDLVPVALAVWLLWQPQRSGLRRLGLDLRRPGRDAVEGLALAAAIGIPGLGLYLVSRLAGLTPAIETNAQTLSWWAVLLLLLSALRAGLLEEVIVVGYTHTRLAELGWGRWQIILGTALLRGSYHLYQGVPMALGNVVMGIVFGWWFQRRGRVAPLVVAHFLLDAVSFLGYYGAAGWLGGLI